MAQLPSTATLSEIIAALQTMEAINQKADLAAAVGSPALATDDMATIISKLQTQKNNLATNLTNKGAASTGAETLKALVDKVGALSGKRIATGTKNFNTGTQPPSVLTVTGLAFRPTRVFLFWQRSNGYWFVFDSNKSATLFYGSGSGDPATITYNADGFTFQTTGSAESQQAVYWTAIE